MPIPMNVTPSIIKKIPAHFFMFICSPKNLVLKRQTQMYDNDTNGYKIERSPRFNAGMVIINEKP